jgi:hypothetical protein
MAEDKVTEFLEKNRNKEWFKIEFEKYKDEFSETPSCFCSRHKPEYLFASAELKRLEDIENRERIKKEHREKAINSHYGL